MRRRHLAFDLFCGLGGWTDGLLAEGWDVIGFDIERHAYRDHRYPAQLILQDVRTIHGSQLKDASLIVASSPCQEFSYRAMPWKRARELGPPHLGMELFAQAFRIQQEAIAAAGRFIPMVQENVRGAQKWVGRARWHYGSFYLWGDVPALMPIVTRGGVKVPGVGAGWRHPDDPLRAEEAGVKNLGGGSWDASRPSHTEDHSWDSGVKNSGGSWFNVAHNTTSGHGQNPVRRKTVGHINRRGGYDHTRHLTNSAEHEGIKQPGITGERDNGKGARWFQDGAAAHDSRSNARKAAAARIAKIPLPLARHIARVYMPAEDTNAR